MMPTRYLERQSKRNEQGTARSGRMERPSGPKSKASIAGEAFAPTESFATQERMSREKRHPGGLGYARHSISSSARARLEEGTTGPNAVATDCTGVACPPFFIVTLKGKDYHSRLLRNAFFHNGGLGLRGRQFLSVDVSPTSGVNHVGLLQSLHTRVAFL
jgi:hypothetical protein